MLFRQQRHHLLKFHRFPEGFCTAAKPVCLKFLMMKYKADLGLILMTILQDFKHYFILAQLFSFSSQIRITDISGASLMLSSKITVRSLLEVLFSEARRSFSGRNNTVSVRYFMVDMYSA